MGHFVEAGDDHARRGCVDELMVAHVDAYVSDGPVASEEDAVPGFNGIV